jgi:metal-responsive CopG/Arc/MetJ family transcriptional regulator
LVDISNMPAKPVQVSIDQSLLRRIDGDPETKRSGRSAFIRSAVSLYLRAKDRRATDDAIRAAYDGKADELLEEIEDLIGTQSWPTK